MTLKKQIVWSVAIGFVLLIVVIVGRVGVSGYEDYKRAELCRSNSLPEYCLAPLTGAPPSLTWPVHMNRFAFIINHPITLLFAFICNWLFWSGVAFIGMRVVGFIKKKNT